MGKQASKFNEVGVSIPDVIRCGDTLRCENRDYKFTTVGGAGEVELTVFLQLETS